VKIDEATPFQIVRAKRYFMPKGDKRASYCPEPLRNANLYVNPKQFRLYPFKEARSRSCIEASLNPNITIRLHEINRNHDSSLG
jgi:hypothetical protein